MTSTMKTRLSLFLSLLALVLSQQAEQLPNASYCVKYRWLYTNFCVPRTETTLRNDADPDNFCPVYDRTCVPQQEEEVVRPRWSDRELFCGHQMLTGNSFRCSSFPDVTQRLYRPCHTFLLTCKEFFRDETPMAVAAYRATWLPAVPIAPSPPRRGIPSQYGRNDLSGINQFLAG